MAKTAQQRLNESISEATFQRNVIELATLLGYTVYHTFNSRHTTARGYPDLALMRPATSHSPARYLLRELKTERGRLRPEQVVWLTTLQQCGVDAKVWRPSDWQEIEQTLKK